MSKFPIDSHGYFPKIYTLFESLETNRRQKEEEMAYQKAKDRTSALINHHAKREKIEGNEVMVEERAMRSLLVA